jgi:hypothetical protein
VIPSMRVDTRQKIRPKTLPAPVGGLNGRDALPTMDNRDAYRLDNWLPGTATVDSRKGTVQFATGLGGPVRSLEVYAGAVGDTLLAFAAGNVYNVTTGIPSSLVAGKTSDEVIAAMFSNAADNSQHLLVTTGVDTPYRYNGTSISNLTITGIAGSATTLNFVFAFKGRAYFGQRDKLGFYYLAPGAIQGAASYFDLGQVSKLGGYLLAIASYSDGSGETPADYIVFITSKGECIVYSGFDPSSVANWQIVGRYYAGTPIGRKCTFNYGSELVLITLEGAISFSEVRRVGDAKARGVSNAEYGAITSKLGGYLSDLNVNANVSGWQGLLAPLEGLLLINAPATTSPSGGYSLFAMNTTTNAWTRIIDWNGISYCVFNKRLYFGTFGGKINLAFESGADLGLPIRLDCKQAYDYFDNGDGANTAFIRKHFQWANILISCNGTPPLSAQFNVDYVETQPEYLNDIQDALGAEWDVATWDLAEWGADETTQRVLVTLNKSGVAGSLWLRGSITGISLKWYATNYAFTRLEGLLI